jgi:hypothetical protein
MEKNLVTFQDVIPIQMTHRGLASGAAHAAQKIRREFLPTNQSTYSFDTNDEIEFHISSVKDLLVASETYLRVNMSTTLQQDFGAGVVVDGQAEFEEGGLHNCFRRIEITDRANRQIDVIEGYDRLSNILSNIYMSPSHVDQNEWQAADSTYSVSNWNNSVSQENMGYTYINHTVSVTTAGVASMAAARPEEVWTGARIRILDSTTYEPLYTGYVESYDRTSTSFNVHPAPIAAVPSGSLLFVETSARRQLAHESGAFINMRLGSGFFSILEDIPLFLMDGLIVKFFLREPRFVFNMGHALQASPARNVDYTISNPRLICTLRTPSEAVRGQYLQLYSSGNLNYVFPAYQTITRQESGSGPGTIELDLPISKSSVRRVVFTIQPQNARGNTSGNNRNTDVYSYPSKSFIDGKLINYQFKVGGRDYPQNRVDISDQLMSEGLNELQRTFNIHGNLNSQMRADWFKYAKFVQGINDEPQSMKAIFATSFATLENDPMSGLKTKGVGSDPHVIVEMEVDAAHEVDGTQGPRYFDFYFEYTKILHLSANGIQILD